MKVLFLHLSDAHLLSNTFIDNKIINAQVQALNGLGEFDKCYIIFSGDLSQSGQENEYKKCSIYLGLLWKRISDKYPMLYPVNTLVVPGNHDIDFEGKARGRSEIAELLSSPVTEEMIAEELQKFDNFYNFAGKYHCFSYNKLIDVNNDYGIFLTIVVNIADTFCNFIRGSNKTKYFIKKGNNYEQLV